MSYTIEDLEAIAKKLRYDLTAMQGKVTDLLNGISQVASTLPARDEVTKQVEPEFIQTSYPCVLCERTTGKAAYLAGQWWCEECCAQYWRQGAA